ncbi:MAG: HAD family hydrolase [Deltaproteobacteria bacterium]|nr:HAD family hydrolase [Deltaproteobacteria bacterium]
MDIAAIRVFIFDVNGVLILSNVGNAQALAESFSDDPAIRERIIALYWTLGGIDRGSKIRTVQERIIGRPFREGEFEQRWERFRKLSSNSMRTAPLGRGCREVLSRLKELGKVRAALSNTPPAQLDEVLKARNLERCFEIVRGGGDWPKSESLARLLAETGFQPGECLFLADGRGDLAAARQSGVPFIGINDIGGEFDGAQDVIGPYPDLGAWGEENLGLKLGD